MVLATSASVKDEQVSQSYCEKLASKLSSISDLPVKCREYKSVVQKLQRSDAYAGMSAGEAGRARAAKAHGLESHAQIQRRLTRGSRTFSKK